jgi:RNA polymerase sigma-70 factor (ECF subfamily)
MESGIDLDRALATLPAHVRLCIVLSYADGMSHSEIVDATGMPLGTVKTHIRRGLEQLRRVLTTGPGSTA